MTRLALEDFLKHQSPDELPKLRVLDMACGSGSFLIHVYEFLLVWYLDWHRARGAKSARYLTRVQAKDGTRTERLKFVERRRILLEHIFGIDIDSQAVEVSKLSLFLKLIEDVTVLPAQLEFASFQKRLLPDMAANIKCGNSIVGPDALDQVVLTDAEMETVKPFSWDDKFGFSQIMNLVIEEARQKKEIPKL